MNLFKSDCDQITFRKCFVIGEWNWGMEMGNGIGEWNWGMEMGNKIPLNLEIKKLYVFGE